MAEQPPAPFEEHEEHQVMLEIAAELFSVIGALRRTISTCSTSY